MKLKNVTVVFENCDSITIDGKYVGEFMDNELSLSRFLDEKCDEIINFMNKALEWQIVSEVGYPTNLDGRTFLIEYFVDFNKSAPVTTSYYVAGCDSNGFFWLENEYYGEYFKEGQVYAWKEIK